MADSPTRGPCAPARPPNLGEFHVEEITGICHHLRPCGQAVQKLRSKAGPACVTYAGQACGWRAHRASCAKEPGLSTGQQSFCDRSSQDVQEVQDVATRELRRACVSTPAAFIRIHTCAHRWSPDCTFRCSFQGGIAKRRDRFLQGRREGGGTICSIYSLPAGENRDITVLPCCC